MRAPGYHPVAKALHWTVAIAVFGLLGVGLWMTGLPFGLTKLQAYAWHKWIGLVVFLLVLARLAWRRYSPPPPLPETITPLERRLVPIGHWSLLVLLLTQPVTGWLMSSAAGVPVYWFGYVPIPDLLSRDQSLFETLRLVHKVLAFMLMATITMHLLAIVRHDVLRRDGIFRRMWP